MKSRMKYKSIILIVILLAITIPLQAQEDIKVEFEEPGLEKAIRKAINKPSGDIYASELEEIKELNAEQLEIKSLKGIEHCITIENLCLASNQISDISPLAGLTSLEKLQLGINKISDISPLININTLEVVDLWDNPLNEEAKNIIIPKLKEKEIEVIY